MIKAKWTFKSILVVTAIQASAFSVAAENRNFYAAYTPAPAPVAQPGQFGYQNQFGYGGFVPNYQNNGQQIDLPFLVSAASTLYAASQYINKQSNSGAVYGSGASSSSSNNTFRDERATPRRPAPQVYTPPQTR